MMINTTLTSIAVFHLQISCIWVQGSCTRTYRTWSMTWVWWTRSLQWSAVWRGTIRWGVHFTVFL